MFSLFKHVLDYFETESAGYEKLEEVKEKKLEEKQIEKVTKVFEIRHLVLKFSKFLEFKDVLQLHWACKEMHSYNLPFYYIRHSLRNVFIPEGFTISGSYLLSLISKFDNGENPNDIDLYTNEVYSPEINQVFEKVEYTDSGYKRLYFGNCRFIDGVQKFEKNGSLKTDIIFVNPSTSVHDMIEENFDISCLKNWYDGKTLYIKNPLFTTGLHPEGKIALLENYKNSYYQRFYKYLNRGYSIYTNNQSIHITLGRITWTTGCTYGFTNLALAAIPSLVLTQGQSVMVKIKDNHLTLTLQTL
jgi:hypothetical protein